MDLGVEERDVVSTAVAANELADHAAITTSQPTPTARLERAADGKLILYQEGRSYVPLLIE
jgi:hypothetical protein